MNALHFELPDDLQKRVAGHVARRGLSESEWLRDAVLEKLAVDAELEALEVRAARGDLAAFERILARVPDVDPIPGDEI